MEDGGEKSKDFIREIIDEDIRSGRLESRVRTRFPPEPNGYLHIGHAKSICLNFSLAEEYGGKCNLRFDDTNPGAEDEEYVNAIIEDVKWLGFDWGEKALFASGYFEQMYEYAVQLIKAGKAYVDDLTEKEISEYRGTINSPGKNSPYRNRSIEENLELFEKMRAGMFKDGEKVLRAKIDMAHPHMMMRDPVMYRIRREAHHRTGEKWCIYPLYDWAHGLEDSIEGITHSICTLEFETHRMLYDWFLDQLEVHHPRQVEFARLNIACTILSKRKLAELVREGHVSGWDDPRMPTLRGMRRRGCPPEAIREFCATIGVAKRPNIVAIELLEHCVRNSLNKTAPRFMAVIDPVKLVIDNYPEDREETLEAINNPEDPAAGTRQLPFSRELYIERADFMEEPPKKFYRLSPGREVRLRYAYFVTCTGVKKNEAGEVTEIHCTYDPATRGGDSPDGRKVKATLHWVSSNHAVDVEARLYDRLFTEEDPAGAEGDPADYLNPKSLEVRYPCKAEPAVVEINPFDSLQFERVGYFCMDSDSTPQRPVFNRTVTLKDTWAKLRKRMKNK